MKTYIKLFLFGLLVGCSASDEKLLFVNANIYTMDSERPKATSFTVLNGNFEVISDKPIHVDETWKIIDLGGKTVLPGLTDGHAHLINLGLLLQKVQLFQSNSIKEIQQRVKVFAENHPNQPWILGRGWDQNLWQGKNFPTATDLDEIISDRPVVLERVDGHALWLNSKAMQIASISENSTDPFGGKILRFPDGTPTGVFIDNADKLVIPFIPTPTDSELKEIVKLAMQEVWKYGITGVHEAGMTSRNFRIIKQWVNEPWFNLRWYVMIESSDEQSMNDFMINGPIENLNRHRLSVRSVKIYSDGALGSRGAHLILPYADDPGNVGLALTDSTEIVKLVSRSVKNGFQVGIHAIGDRSNRIALNIFDAIIPQDGINRRMRIEHVQLLQQSDIERFKTLNVIASMQPIHATSDMGWAEQRVGSRIRGGYVWNSLLKSGAKLNFGSDFPVEPVNPWLGIYAAVNRQDENGKPQGGWYPDETISLEQSLNGFTKDAAFASFMERFTGTISSRKYADFIVLDRDPFAIRPSSLKDVQVLQTWIDGKKVFQKD